MFRTLEVEIDEAGNIHTVDAHARPPAGRAKLIWDAHDDELYPALMAEKSHEDWLRPEEDKAWAYLQPDKQCCCVIRSPI